MKSSVKFATREGRELAPVEVDDDIGLGLFLRDEKRLPGTWEKP